MSGKDRLGGYTWWPTDYQADEHVRMMTYEQEGIYRALLDHAWLHGSIPADMTTLVKLLGKGLSARRFAVLWPGIAPCWQPGADGRLVNGRLERERADLMAFRAERSESGRKGAASRRSARAQRQAQPHTEPLAQPHAEYVPPTPTPSPTPIRRASESIAPSEGRAAPKSSSLARTNNELPGHDRRRAEGQGMTHIAVIVPKEVA